MDLKKVKKKYKHMTREELQQLKNSYNPNDYPPAEQKLIEDTFAKFDVHSESDINNSANRHKRTSLKVILGFVFILSFFAIKGLVRYLGKKVKEHKRETKRENRLPGYNEKFVQLDESPETILDELPRKIGNFIAEKEILFYQNQKLGASLGYNTPQNIIATIYVYDLGKNDIPDGIDSNIVKSAYKQALSDIKYSESVGEYQNVKLLHDEPTDISLNSREYVRFLCAVFSYDKKDKREDNIQPVQSELYMTGKRNHIFKIRVTYPPKDSKYVRSQIDQLLKNIFITL
jgi:hypothetical protein